MIMIWIDMMSTMRTIVDDHHDDHVHKDDRDHKDYHDYDSYLDHDHYNDHDNVQEEDYVDGEPVSKNIADKDDEIKDEL